MTRQAPDWIILHGRRERLSNFPWPFPPDFQLPKGWAFHGTSTAHARGYTATWWILADSLFLKQVGATTACWPDRAPRHLSMKDMLGTEAPVFAQWFSGRFYVVVREPDDDTCEEDWSAYDEYREVEVVSGLVVVERLVSRSEKNCRNISHCA